MTTTYSAAARHVGPWVLEKAGGSFNSDMTAIGQLRDGQLIAGVVYDCYTGASVAMHSRCDGPRAISRKFYWMIFDYPFVQLGVKRVTGIVSETNVQARRVNEHLGFTLEARLHDYFREGDGLIYVMRKEDCRWLQLGRRYANEVRYGRQKQSSACA